MEEIAEVKRKAMDEIIKHAVRLHQLLDPGMSVTVNIPRVAEIVVPGLPPEMGQLIITKPGLHINAHLRR